MDADAIAEPSENGAAAKVDPDGAGMVTGESPRQRNKSDAHETLAPSGPCPDCQRYAQMGYLIGVAVGLAAGGVVAYIVLRNRLSPIDVT